jgi:hypothetical protein
MFGSVTSPDCIEHLVGCLKASKCDALTITAEGTVILKRDGHEHTFSDDHLEHELLNELDARYMDALLAS